MLAELRVESFAIIDALSVRFGKGLNVLTGETGAGKSILMDALALLLGGRGDPAVIRAGRDEAVVEGLFVGPGLGARARELGLPGEEDELLIRRTIVRGGRGRVHVNGALSTVSLLATLARGLCDLSGQHEHLSLLSPARHLDLLDEFAGLAQARARYGEAFTALRTLSVERDALVREEVERARRADYLGFQLQELDALAPSPGEEERLSGERRTLAAAEKLQAAASAVEEATYSGEGAVVDTLGTALRRLEEAAALDPRLDAPRQLLTAARAEVDEAGRGLARYLQEARAEPERLAAVDERLAALRSLARKHGGSLDAALSRADEMRNELALLARSGERCGELAPALVAARAEAERLAAALGKGRRAAARRFAEAVSAELGRLSMEGARLKVVFTPAAGEGTLPVGTGRLSARGAEEAEFLLGANVGEEPRPLARTASGGELSRALLALKRALAEADPVATYLFDEVDAGIGGSTALTVGRMLREVAAQRQVLCVTHLPQVAACADVHLAVEKLVAAGRTSARVLQLGDGEPRRRAIARMLSGSDRAPAALAAAEELLVSAREVSGGRQRKRAAEPSAFLDGVRRTG